jgi:hypothetical protein
MNGMAPRGRDRKRAAPDGSGPPLAPFVSLEVAALEHPMWPLHYSAWLQPEAVPALPAWSGLTIERRYRLPAPDFVLSEVEPFPLSAAAHRACDPVPPAACPGLPASGLAPAGWEPRAFLAGPRPAIAEPRPPESPPREPRP